MRIAYLDFVKCIAIFLVLWGHAITQMMPHDLSTNEVYVAIYSFHMPLFMMVSGLFAASSYKLPIMEITKKKFMQLILPSFTFGALWFLIQHHEEIINLQFSFLGFIKHEAAAYWFLKSLFLCYLICYRKHWWFIALSFLILCFIQRWEITAFKTGNMLPFFCLGILMKDKLELLKSNSNYIFLISLIAFVICLNWYSLEYSFANYFFKAINANGLLHFLFYFITALSGSMSVITACMLLSRVSSESRILALIQKIGTTTLGIYLWQKILLEVTLPLFWHVEMPFWCYNYLFTPLLSLVFLFICYYMSIRKFPSLPDKHNYS